METETQGSAKKRRKCSHEGDTAHSKNSNGHSANPTENANNIDNNTNSNTSHVRTGDSPGCDNSLSHERKESEWELFGSIGCTIINNIPCPILIFTRSEHTIIHTNESFACFVGRQREKIIGCNVSDYLRVVGGEEEGDKAGSVPGDCATAVKCQVKCLDISGKYSLARSYTRTCTYTLTLFTACVVFRRQCVIFRGCSEEISMCCFVTTTTDTGTPSPTTPTPPMPHLSIADSPAMPEEKLQWFEVAK